MAWQTVLSILTLGCYTVSLSLSLEERGVALPGILPSLKPETTPATLLKRVLESIEAEAPSFCWIQIVKFSGPPIFGVMA